jgi:hypothetical protein
MTYIAWGVLLLQGALAVAAPTSGPAAPPAASTLWRHGPAPTPDDFPVAVWLQSPANAGRYKAAGINLYVGLHKGPTDAQLDALKAAGLRVICEQNEVGLKRKDDPTIVGWMHGDEPDNAQPATDPKTGKPTWGPPVPPERIVADYQKLRAADPTRPILLNLGQGVANDRWKGRGSGAKLDDYLTYVRGSDIVSFDVYPVSTLREQGDGEGAELLHLVAKGVERLTQWTSGRGEPKLVWSCIETGVIGDPARKPTPHQVKAEVWMAVIHGARGIIYFVHQFKPRFNEHALLDDPEMLAAVTAVNAQLRELAPVINAPAADGAVKATTSDANVPVAATARRHNGATYVFAVGMRNAATTATFTLTDPPAGAAEAEVIGEGRRVPVKDGAIVDAFGAYDVHLYRLGR